MLQNYDGAIKLGWIYYECQQLSGKHEIYTLHKPRSIDHPKTI